MTPEPTGPRRRLPLSLAARLGLGFALMAAILIVGHAAARRDMRAVIETMQNARTAQVPLARAADVLTDRVLAFDRAVLADVRMPTEANRDIVAEAERALFAGLDVYAGLQPAAPGVVALFRGEAEEHTRLGWSLIDASTERQAALNGIRKALDQLTRRISRAFAENAKLPDPALARRAYADLELELSGLRAAFNDYLISGPQAADTALRAATRSFSATLAEYRDELRRSPGKAWVELVEEDLRRVEKLRNEVRRNDASIEALRQQFAESGQQLPLRLDAVLALPASRAVAASAGSAAEATRSAEVAIGRLTYLVLAATLLVSLLTAIAVTRPVRRLIHATRAVARGEQRVSVPPGGCRELDELGAAFNHMAEQLAAANLQVAHHHEELENRVRSRTRKLAHLANHDPLTGLPNRRLAFNHLRRAVRRATGGGDGIGLMALDIDNFKAINDTLGHDVGDALLVGVADRLRSLVGERPFIARIGGDEFVVSLEAAGQSDTTLAVAERILDGFRAPLNLGGREVLVSLSIGAARLPEHANDAPGLVRAADAALFRAKSLGRNRIEGFTPGLLEDSEAHFALEQSLRRAADAGELTLVYQPQISLAGGATEVVEALLRWRRADGSLVPAGEFIPIAEQSGLIIEIGERILEMAATAVADWRANGFRDARVAINVSVHQLLDNRFVDRLTETLARHRLPADAIELELTETAFQTSPSTIRALLAMREGGVGLALDDFGMGYSSVTSLSHLPLRRVKMDRSLMVNVPESERAASLARAIINVCQNLGLEVTVEGIERQEQLAWLAGCGPLHVQGFLIAKPMTAAYVPRFARRSPQLLAELLGGAALRTRGRDEGDLVLPFRTAPGMTER